MLLLPMGWTTLSAIITVVVVVALVEAEVMASFFVVGFRFVNWFIGEISLVSCIEVSWLVHSSVPKFKVSIYMLRTPKGIQSSCASEGRV